MATNRRWNEADIDAALSSLGVHDMSAERTERIRSRARQALAARSRSPRAADVNWRRLEPLAALAAGLAYMSVVFRLAMALYG